MCTDMCRGLEITGHSESCPGPGSRVSEHCEGPGNTGALSRHRLPPGISSAISRLSLRPPRSRAVNEDLFMFGMDSSRNGPKNSDGNFIVVWDNINNPDILYDQRCDMFHIGEGTLLKQIRKTFTKQDNDSIDALKIIVLQLGKINVKNNVKSIKELF